MSRAAGVRTGSSREAFGWLRSPVTGRQSLAPGLTVFTGVLTDSVLGGVLTRATMPDASGMVRALVLLVGMTAVAVAVRSWFGSWADLGVNGPRAWSRNSLLVVPLLLALSPLVLGVRHLSGATWSMLVVGYALTGSTPGNACSTVTATSWN